MDLDLFRCGARLLRNVVLFACLALLTSAPRLSVAANTEEAGAAYNRGDYSKSFEIYSTIAAEGANPEAKYWVARHLYEGRGVDKNVAAAVEIFSNVADQHAHVYGMIYAGIVLSSAAGSEDKERAIGYLQQAMSNLGVSPGATVPLLLANLLQDQGDHVPQPVVVQYLVRALSQFNDPLNATYLSLVDRYEAEPDAIKLAFFRRELSQIGDVGIDDERGFDAELAAAIDSLLEEVEVSSNAGFEYVFSADFAIELVKQVVKKRGTARIEGVPDFTFINRGISAPQHSLTFSPANIISSVENEHRSGSYSFRGADFLESTTSSKGSNASVIRLSDSLAAVWWKPITPFRIAADGVQLKFPIHEDVSEISLSYLVQYCGQEGIHAWTLGDISREDIIDEILTLRAQRTPKGKDVPSLFLHSWNENIEKAYRGVVEQSQFIDQTLCIEGQGLLLSGERGREVSLEYLGFFQIATENDPEAVYGRIDESQIFDATITLKDENGNASRLVPDLNGRFVVFGMDRQSIYSLHIRLGQKDYYSAYGEWFTPPASGEIPIAIEEPVYAEGQL